MNNKGAGPSLTWVVIAIAMGVGSLLLITNFYTGFLTENSGIIDSTYNSYYANLSSTTQLNMMKANLTDFSAITTIKQIISSTGNVFLIGLGAMQSMLNMITFVPVMISTILSALYLPDAVANALGWLIPFVIVIYISMKYIRGARGTVEEI